MEKDGLVFEQITAYMRSVRREREGYVGDLERRARDAGYPISEPETADLLEILCLALRPHEILEIGTCVGFSALLMRSACPDAHITTLERNPAMIGPARMHFEKYHADTVEMIEGQASETLEKLTGPYDLIFLDAAKGQYPLFLKHCKRLLRKGGILVADNVLFNGMVATQKPDCHRNATIVHRLDEYLRTLEADPDFKTVILPISDGVTVSYKIGG